MGNKTSITEPVKNYHKIYHYKSTLGRWYEFRVPAYTRISWKHLKKNPQIRIRMNNNIKTLPECLSEFYTSNNTNIILEVNYSKRKTDMDTPVLYIVN